MKELLSKFNYSSFLMLAGAVFSIVGGVLYAINSNHEYLHNFSVLVLLLIIAAAVLLIATPVLAAKLGSSEWLTLALAAIVILLTCAVMMTIVNCALSLSVVLFSNIEADNVSANAAIRQFIVTDIVLLIPIILTIIVGFCKLGRATGKRGKEV